MLIVHRLFTRSTRSNFDFELKVTNAIFGGLLIAFTIYSIIISTTKSPNVYAIKCAHLALTHTECHTCGLTRAYIQILKGEIDLDKIISIKALYVFLYVHLQLILRFVNLSLPGYYKLDFIQLIIFTLGFAILMNV